MKKVQAILFDFDGVILNTFESYRKMVLEILHEFNYDITLEESKTRWRYLLGTKVYKELKNEGYEWADEFLETVKKRSLIRDFSDSIIVDGLTDVLNSLDLLRCVCTNGECSRIKSNLEEVKLLNYFNEVIGRDNTGTKKPNPMVYIKGAEILNVDIKNCLVIEDSIDGLQAGRASGAITVAFTGTGGIKEELAKENPNYIINDLRDIIKIVNDLNK